ncbi:unnamed protein product [Moneuplotes crassus]|uniref:RRM domain-containing protein n=1 Tax=Euplotes crassus TaxID=5936 RepID=A0AAD1Y4A0_EUPCR|nr:unnamed protein product [Moneuplotes crassus]
MEKIETNLEEETKEKDPAADSNSIRESNQNESDTNKPRDPEVDTDEGDMVKDEFVVSLGYYKGDYEKSLEYRENILVRDVDNKLMPACKTSNYKFGNYGAGVYLYFEYLKFLSIAFAIMSIIMLPSLICNLIGDYYNSETGTLFDFTTLGNQKGYVSGTSDSDSLKVDDDNEASRALTITSDVINTVALYIFLMVFNAVSRHKMIDLMKRKQTPSDYSIYVTGFPDDSCSEEDIREYFSKYGEVLEIVFARRFGKMMKGYMAQDKINKNIKKREIQVKVEAEKDESLSVLEAVKNDKKLQKLVKKDIKMEQELREKYPKIKCIEDVPSIGAFVVFNKSEDAITCLKAHRLNYTKLRQDEKEKIKGKYKAKVIQADEPSNILWENLEVSYLESFLRSLVVILIVIVLLVGTLCAVYGLRVYQEKIPVVTACEQYDNLTLGTVDHNNKDALDCVCQMKGLVTIIFTSSIRKDCQEYMENEIFRYLVNIAVALLVSVINILIKICFNVLSKFERYKAVTHLNGAIMRKTFISTFINMGLLYLLINANFRSSGFVRTIASGLPGGKKYFFNGDYDDLNRDWYSKVAISIIVLSLTNLVSVVIGAAINETINWIKRKYFAKRQTLQHDMNACMDGNVFTISTKYSTTLALIFVTIIYFGPVPLLVVICCMYLTTNYWLDKFIFVRFCKIPPYTGPSMHISVLRYLPISLMLHCIFSMWAYGSPEVYPDGFYADGTNSDGYTIYRPNDRNFGERLTNKNSLIFFILFILFVIAYIFENIIHRIIMRVLKPSNVVDVAQKTFKEAEPIMKEWTVTSYQPHMNLKYDKILKAMLDVAEVNPDIHESEEEKLDHNSKSDSQQNLVQENAWPENGQP